MRRVTVSLIVSMSRLYDLESSLAILNVRFSGKPQQHVNDVVEPSGFCGMLLKCPSGDFLIPSDHLDSMDAFLIVDSGGLQCGRIRTGRSTTAITTGRRQAADGHVGGHEWRDVSSVRLKLE
jgi:hypothetical protein